MAQSRKSPIHPSAAKLGDIHPSPATWVKFVMTTEGPQIDKIGQFLTDFHSDNGHIKMLRATFRTTYWHPYFGQQSWRYMPSELGLTPMLDWYRRYHDAPPTDEFISQRFGRMVVRDPRDPYLIWESSFVVKLQRAHGVLGCTPDEFRRTHLVDFHKKIVDEAAALFWIDADDERRWAAEAAMTE